MKIIPCTFLSRKLVSTEKIFDKLNPKFCLKLCNYETFFSSQDSLYCFLHCLSLDVISDRIDINVLKIPLSTCSPVSGHIKIILETVIYRGEKSLLVLIYSSDSYNLGALAT